MRVHPEVSLRADHHQVKEVNVKKLIALCFLAGIAGCSHASSSQPVPRGPQPGVQSTPAHQAPAAPKDFGFDKFKEPRCKDGKCPYKAKEV